MIRRILNKHCFRFWVVLFVLFLCVFLSIPVYAIANPNVIAFGSATPIAIAFTNVHETDDMYFVAESYIYYTPSYPSETSSQAFIFELLSTDGVTVLVSTPVWSYGDRPVSIYLTAAQVSSMGLVSGSIYFLRITGNPALFGTITEGTNQVTSGISTWIDQSVATSDPSSNPLRATIITMATNIQTNDAPTYAYLTSVSGVEYLSSGYGDNVFLGGMPQLQVFCPSVFQVSVAPVVPETPASSGSYASGLNILGQLGPNISTGLTNFGTWLGIPQNMAGGVVFLGFTGLFCGFVYRKTGHPLMPLAIGGVMPVFGAWLGLIPLALVFMMVTLMVVLLLWHFLGSKSF